VTQNESVETISSQSNVQLKIDTKIYWTKIN